MLFKRCRGHRTGKRPHTGFWIDQVLNERGHLEKTIEDKRGGQVGQANSPLNLRRADARLRFTFSVQIYCQALVKPFPRIETFDSKAGALNKFADRDSLLD